MNWREIKEKSPLAFDKVQCYLFLSVNKYNQIEWSEEYNCFYLYNQADQYEGCVELDLSKFLYDCFDTQEINTYYESNHNLIIKEPSTAATYILTEKGWMNDIEFVFDSAQPLKIKTRTEAETILFEKCFEILNTRLLRKQE